MSEGVLCKGFYKKKTQKAQLRDDNDVLFGVTTLVWNDKLKPYGFCLHGCINGYSRRCMWLHVGTTNKDAAVVATLYLNTVNQLEGCPQLVRSDPGTENVVVAAMQCSFHCNHYVLKPSGLT
ncbi:uncharacterized protein [Branchiostoma lanceolatum]|uniref:uncharacterized protein isoform X2 n=1 Tax=Branchiostoma lanceolatum TaxID=7740 RepID=UPI0034548E08